MTRTIPVTDLFEPGAYGREMAAWYIGTSTTTLWRLVNLPKSDPMRIRPTPYGTYAKAELDRHLMVATERNRV